VSCHKRKNPQDEPLAVRVYRDPANSSSVLLVSATKQFVSSHPHASNGRKLMISLSASPSYQADLQSLEAIRPQIVILNAEADLLPDAAVRAHLGDPEPVCGSHPAYLPDWSSTDERDAALMFLQFLRDHCSPPPQPALPQTTPESAPSSSPPTQATPSTNP
jgi:hypothetical protein